MKIPGDDAVDKNESPAATGNSDNGVPGKENAPDSHGVAGASDEAAEAGEAPSGSETTVQASSAETPVTRGSAAATVPVASAHSESGQEAETPAAGDVAEYSTNRELGRDTWGRILLAWRSDPETTEDQEPPVVLLERTSLDVAAAQRIIDFHLYHARLLAPRAVVERDNGVYWLVVEAPASYEAPFAAISDGGRLDTRGTLKAGVGLANALSYLHTNGFAHGHVGPMAILVHDGRAYLSGVELASVVESTEASSAALFTADVNALAQMLAPLAGLPAEAPSDEAAPARALREIRAKGIAGTFQTSEELAQECGQALQEPALTLPAVDTTATRPLVFHTGTATTVGLLRSQNQDALACTVLNIRDDIGRDQPLGIFLVADGMGGEAAGEIASRIGARIATAELVRQLLVPTVAMPALDPFSPEHTTGAITVATLAQALAIAVDAANRQVRALASALQESTGTTLTAVVAAGTRAVLAHLGDSRAYLLRNDMLVQLTKDHSLLARLTELDHPLLNDPSFGMPRNYLYRSLGQEDEAPPDMMEFVLAPGDRLLLCSDGLWDELDDTTIHRGLISNDDPAECANHLVRLANAAGGHDNSTAVVVFVEAQRDDPASEISPEEIEAILRATGAFDDADDAVDEASIDGSGDDVINRGMD
ncbi:MAG TPA: protein phosphatase 2C domain-containing protein [Ktedonobacterales bacterium]